MELKRGFFFSLISLLLLIGLFFLAQPRPYESTIVLEQTHQERILFTNSIIQSFEQGYLTRAIESQSVIVLEAIAGYREAEHSGLYTSREELESDFAEGLIAGTFDDGSYEASTYLPTDLSGAQRSLATLLDLYANASGQNFNIRFDFSERPEDYEVRLFQDELTGPWQVGVELTLAYNVTPGLPSRTDVSQEIAVWRLNRTVTTYVNIRGVRDPYLYVRSGGDIEAPIQEFFTERWNRPAFITYVESGRYFPTNRSMSLLGRYYDSMEYAQCCGMMTTINRDRYADYNSTIGDRYANITYIDCGYFPTSPVTPVCRQPEDSLVYAVRGLSDGLPSSGPVVVPSSTFPFTMSSRIGLEVFNLTVGPDLIDTLGAIS